MSLNLIILDFEVSASVLLTFDLYKFTVSVILDQSSWMSNESGRTLYDFNKKKHGKIYKIFVDYLIIVSLIQYQYSRVPI